MQTSMNISAEAEVQRAKRYIDRLTELCQLSDGWNGPESLALGALAYSNAVQFLGHITELAYSGKYYIYPTILGGALFEFIVDGPEAVWDLSIEFKSDGSIEFFGIETEQRVDDYVWAAYTAVDDEFMAALNLRIKMCCPEVL